MLAPVKLFAPSFGGVAYSGAQWLLFTYVVATGGLRAGGDYALVQAVAAPVFALASLSLRQLWVAGTIQRLSYRQLAQARTGLTVAALVIILAIVGSTRLSATPLVLAVVLTLKTCEPLSDILHARLDAAGDAWLSGVLATLRGGVISAIVLVGWWFGLGVGITIPAVLAAAIVLVAVDAAVAFTRPSKAFDGHRSLRRVLPQLAGSLAWVSAANLIVTISGFLPRYALDLVDTRETVGLFSAVTLPITLLLLIVTGLAQASLRDLADTVRVRDAIAFAKLMVGRVSIILGIVAVTALFALTVAPYAAALAGFRIEQRVFVTVALLLPFYLPGFVAQLVSYAYLAVGNYRALASLNALVFIVQLVIVVPLLRIDPIFGGAGLATIGSLVQLSGFFYLMRRHFSPHRA